MLRENTCDPCAIGSSRTIPRVELVERRRSFWESSELGEFGTIERQDDFHFFARIRISDSFEVLVHRLRAVQKLHMSAHGHLLSSNRESSVRRTAMIRMLLRRSGDSPRLALGPVGGWARFRRPRP